MGENLPTLPDRITPERQRLLDKLAERTYSSITELCKDAEVSRDTYYAAVKDKAFVDKLFQNSKSTFYMAIPEVMNKIVKQAKQGSLFHQQFLLKMLDVYDEKPGVQVNVQNNTLNLNSEDVESAVKWYVKQNPEKVRGWLEE